MLEGKTESSVGQSSPFDGLINAEIEIVRNSGDASGEASVVGNLAGALEDTLGGTVPNVVEERERMTWISEWALKDLGIQSPVELLNLVSRLDSYAKSRWPRYGVIDRVYLFAREQKAMRALSEVRRG